MCWVLDADINLGGGTIKAVGRHTTGFQGTLYGNKHVIKNGTVQYETWIDNTTQYAVGLFHKINGGKVYDLNIDSTIKFTMITTLGAPANPVVQDSFQVYMGGLAAVAYNTTAVGVSSKVSMSVSQTATTVTTCAVGGICGYAKDMKLYKSGFSGNIYYKTGTGHQYVNGDGRELGGLIGQDHGAGATVIDQCYVAGSVVAENNGANVGGILAYPKFTSTGSLTITNCVIDTAVKVLGPDGTTNVGDCALITGEDMFQAAAYMSSVKCENIYFLGNAKVYRGSSDTTGGLYIMSAENGSGVNTTPIYESSASNIVLPIGTTVPVYPSYLQSSANNKKVDSVANVVSSANSNPAISNNYTLTNAGGITSNNVSSGHIAFIKGAGR